MMQSVVYNAKSHVVASASPNFPKATSKGTKYQHIAPAPSVLQSSSSELKHTPRKYMPRATNVPYSVDQTQSVQRRNARERNRVKQVNNSFAKLRQHIPQTIITDLTKGGGRGPHKKISKVDTLRIAVEYIRRLQDLIEDRNVGVGCDVGLCNNNNKSINGSDDKFGRLSSENLSNISFISSASSGGSSKNCFEGDSPSSPCSPSTAITPPAIAATGSSSGYFTSSPLLESPTLPPYQQHFTSTLLTPVSLKTYPLDGGNSSPTSSFNSSISFDSGTFEPTPTIPSAHNTHNNNSNNNNNSHDTHMNAHLQLKFEPYDSFHLHEEDCQPDDEEILDYISLWQEQ